MSDLILSSKDFKTLSSDTRVQIMKLLAARNHNLTELSAKLGIALPSVKQHINILLESSLIILSDSSHKWKYYSLSRKGKMLLEPEGSQGSQIMIVLSSSLIGLVGIALIVAALFGSTMLSAGSFQASAPMMNSSGDKVLSAGVPIVTEATIDKQAAASSALQETPEPRHSSGFLGFNPIAMSIVGALLLAFSVVFYLRKAKSFR